MPSRAPLTSTSSYSIEALISMVERGEIRIPSVTTLTWRPVEVERLFDSIYRGYPIGTLLFWSRTARADSVKIGPVTVDVPAAERALWVVDGIKRVTTLVGALLHPDSSHGHDPLALGFDVAAEEFRHRKRGHSPSWMPLDAILDRDKRDAWLRSYRAAPGADPIATVRRVTHAIRHYVLTATLVSEEDPSVVREMYERLNATKRTVDPEELFDAIDLGPGWKGAHTLRALSQEVAELGYGRFEPRWIQKAVLAVAGGDARAANEQSIRFAAGRALREVAIFLRRDAGLQHLSLLPYGLPVPHLARFFHLHPAPKARSRDLLARWFWRGAIKGDHGEERATDARRMTAALALPEEEAVQAMLRALSGPSFEPVELQPFAWKSARTKLETSALLELGPRDLASGAPLPIAELLEAKGAAAVRQIFPAANRSQDRDLRLGFRSSPWGTLANRFLNPSGESPTRLFLRALRLPGGEAALRSHALEPEWVAPLAQGGAEAHLAVAQLLTNRHNRLLQAIERFIALRARWHETDRPSLESLSIPDSERADA